MRETQWRTPIFRKESKKGDSFFIFKRRKEGNIKFVYGCTWCKRGYACQRGGRETIDFRKQCLDVRFANITKLSWVTNCFWFLSPRNQVSRWEGEGNDLPFYRATARETIFFHPFSLFSPFLPVSSRYLVELESCRRRINDFRAL